MIHEDVTTLGDIFAKVEYSDGSPDNRVVTVEYKHWKNTILATGRSALAAVLVNDIGDTFDKYINRMLFGNSGTADGVPKFVNDSRQGLFGLTVLSKPVIASVDNSNPTTAIFTSVIAFSEANSLTLNEMALQMANGDLYSMRTFPDLNKTSTMQLTLNWRLNFL